MSVVGPLGEGSGKERREFYRPAQRVVRKRALAGVTDASCVVRNGHTRTPLGLNLVDTIYAASASTSLGALRRCRSIVCRLLTAAIRCASKSFLATPR